MARFILTSAVIGAPPGFAYSKFPRGTTICDIVENQQPGDIVWWALCNSSSAANMAPLDARAQAMMHGSTIITKEQLASSSIGGAAGEGAGS